MFIFSYQYLGHFICTVPVSIIPVVVDLSLVDIIGATLLLLHFCVWFLVIWYWTLTMTCHPPSSWVLHTESSILLKTCLLTSKSMYPRWFLIHSNWRRRLTVRGLSTLAVYCIKLLLLRSKPIWESTYLDLRTHSHSHLSTYIISKNSKHKTWSEETWRVSRTSSPKYCREKQQKQHHKSSGRNNSEGL